MRECAGYEFVLIACVYIAFRCNMRECAGYEIPFIDVAKDLTVAICESVPGTRPVSIIYILGSTVAICESVPGTRSP